MNKVARLIDQFAPDHYDVSFNIDAGERSFSGSVTIQGTTPSDQDAITLHAKGLTVTSARIDGKMAQYTDSNQHHEVQFSTGNTLSAGSHQIYVEFSGKISDAMQGIYPSTFTVDGLEKAIIATQFESNHAREALPCIDEPSAKATFALTIATNSSDVVLSNTPIETQKKTNDRTITTFEKTPRMSTYLLAFATGDMHHVERTSKNGVAIAAYASTAQPKEFLDYSADEAVSILDFFEDYFGVPYPLKKCDLVALPDFDAGAMENWGMITFREIAMLADPKNRSVSNEQYVSMVVAHELSHMWFGNLVTMAWWDDLWLNESFASLMEHIALDATHPEWHQWEHYAASDILTTTSRDIHKDIQPISMEIEDPELIETLFDPGIVYTKGGRLLKMLREHIGDGAFRAGLTQYFTTHAYKNTVREDLWKAFSDASGEDVGELMSKWLNQPGMPMVTVTQENTSATVSQTRFVVGSDAAFDQVWPIPLLPSSELEPAILEKEKHTYTLKNQDPLILNMSASGHFIGYYATADHRAAIASALAQKQLPSHGRINTLNDIVLLSRKGLLPFVESLDIVSQMNQEDRFPVWAQIARIIGSAQQLTEDNEEARAQLRALRKEMAQENYDRLGLTDVEDEDPNDTQMRSMMLSMMLGAEEESALSYANSTLKDAATVEDLPSESRASLLGALVKHGDEKLVETLIQHYPKASSDMQLDTISSLSGTRDPKLAKTILEKAIGDDGFVKTQDVLRVLAFFLRNHYIRETTWDFMVGHWDWLVKSLNHSKSFDYLPTYCAAVVSDETMAKRYRDLFEPYKEHKMLKRNVAIGLADIEARVSWRQQNQRQVEEWLQNRYG